VGKRYAFGGLGEGSTGGTGVVRPIRKKHAEEQGQDRNELMSRWASSEGGWRRGREMFMGLRSRASFEASVSI
jgi:hypothetical protein